MRLRVRPLASGRGSGAALTLSEPLSFWGGFDPASGEVIDFRHPQRGAQLSGRVVVMPGSRGSSSTSAMLAEAIRLGTAPAGLVLGRADGVIALGAIVAAELYGRGCPVVVVEGRLPAFPDGIAASVLSDPQGGFGEFYAQWDET